MLNNFEATIELLCSTSKLERDKGVGELEKLLTSNAADGDSLRKCLQRHLINALIDAENTWERKHGCLLAAKCLLTYQNCETVADSDFISILKNLAKNHLTDSEPRVRVAAGALLGVLCHKMGPEVYHENRQQVLSSIKNNLERVVGDEDSLSRREMFETVQLMDKLMSGPSLKKRGSTDAAQSFYDTAGWKNLETSLKALQFMVEGCGSEFQTFMDEEFLTVIFKTVTHSNHFVRETGFYLCSSLLLSLGNDNDVELSSPVLSFGRDVSRHLAEGLADNWSQVRLAASVATRNFLLGQPEDIRHLFYPQLLPRMCLNRYFAADGVRIYSQETWRQVTGASGKDLVQRYIEPTVEYYKSATESKNESVREAACSCISELATKLAVNCVRPLVSGLLQTLLACSQDLSWPVRDAACHACGNFVLSFPMESQPALDLLYPMFHRNLSDPITSVRQGAAAALANVVRAFGEPALSRVASFLQDGFQGMEKQAAEDKTDVDEPLRHCSAKRMRDNDCVMDGYPSSRRRTSVICIPSRPPQPWELADGCVYLLGELSTIKEAHNLVVSSLPSLKDAARPKHYQQHVILLETICKQLPVIAKNLGKRTFSCLVMDWFDEIFYALESENRMTSSAASQCLNQLATFLGQNVLRAKVANSNARHVAALESVIFVAPF